MQLTWLLPASLLFVGVGYVVFQRAQRTRVVGWTLLGASLFALATRDLFRSREQGRPEPAPRESSTESTNERSPDRRTDRSDDDRRRTPLFVRFRRRVAGWLN